MEQVAVFVPTEVMYDTKMSVEQTQNFVNKTIAVEYYKNYGISLGYCAEIAKMNKEDFCVCLELMEFQFSILTTKKNFWMK